MGSLGIGLLTNETNPNINQNPIPRTQPHLKDHNALVQCKLIGWIGFWWGQNVTLNGQLFANHNTEASESRLCKTCYVGLYVGTNDKQNVRMGHSSTWNSIIGEWSTRQTNKTKPWDTENSSRVRGTPHESIALGMMPASFLQRPTWRFSV